MGHGYKHGAVGGDAGLNFKIIGGTTQPASPAENTIWVNTDVDITSYVFSPVEPEAPEEGMVWFTTGFSSTVAFNALKKNGIEICPLSAKQYISGAWVNVTSKSYLDGEWLDWTVYAYNKGDTCDSLHGGWTTSTRWYKVNAGLPTITYNEDSITFKVYSSSAGNWRSGIGETVDGFDLTPFSTMVFKITGLAANQAFDGDWTDALVGVSPSLSGGVTMAAEVRTIAVGTYTLDISELEGVHDIIVKLVANGTAGSYTSMTISEIRMIT